MAPQIYEPADAAGVAAVLQAAGSDSLSVYVRGAATKVTPPQCDVVISTAKLAAKVDHVAGDLVATLPAGMPLDTANEILRRQRQWLPIDPPRGHRATIGGVPQRVRERGRCVRLDQLFRVSRGGHNRSARPASSAGWRR